MPTQWPDRETRPLTKREERRYSKRAARRYMHMSDYRPCGIGFCWRCLWKEYTGAHEKARQAIIRRAEDLRGTAPVIRRELTDEVRERVFEIRHAKALSIMGQVVCGESDAPHDLTPCDPPCNACDAGLLPRCPECGAAT